MVRNISYSNTFSSMSKIGLFDSGVGGLSLFRTVALELPKYDLVYFADQKYCPYGLRPPQEIRALSRRIVEFLITENCHVIIIACNTASVIALYYLREAFPHIKFIGVEPAVRPAASATRSGKIAVLATLRTLDSDFFAHSLDEFARNVQVLTVYPTDWVERVERGEMDSPETFASVQRVIEPLLAQGVDEIVLGCTHYPFLAPLIEKIADGRASILDPSDAVAKQTARVNKTHEVSKTSWVLGQHAFYTTGDVALFKTALKKLLDIADADVRQALL